MPHNVQYELPQHPSQLAVASITAESHTHKHKNIQGIKTQCNETKGQHLGAFFHKTKWHCSHYFSNNNLVTDVNIPSATWKILVENVELQKEKLHAMLISLSKWDENAFMSSLASKLTCLQINKKRKILSLGKMSLCIWAPVLSCA